MMGINEVNRSSRGKDAPASGVPSPANQMEARSTAFHRELRKLDLNLLVTLDALLVEGGNVTRAADRLAISQPAASHALSRLREALDDPLFVKTGIRMEPTARALALAPQVAAWLQQGLGLFQPSADPDPARMQAEIRLTFPEHIETLLLPALLERLFHEAPGIQIHARSLPLDRVLDAVDTGEVDLALIAATAEPRAWQSREPLFDVGFVLMYDPRQVTLPPRPTLAQLSRLPQLALGYVGSYPSAVDRYFAERGAPRRQTATAVGVAAVPQMVRRLPIVAILPDLIELDEATRAALVIEPFAPGDLMVKVSMVWHRRQEAGALAYVRAVLRELTGEGVHGVLR